MDPRGSASYNIRGNKLLRSNVRKYYFLLRELFTSSSNYVFKSSVTLQLKLLYTAGNAKRGNRNQEIVAVLQSRTNLRWKYACLQILFRNL